MSGIRSVIFSLLFYQAAGLTVSFAFVRQNELGKNYFRIHGLIAIVVALIAMLLVQSATSTMGNTGLWVFITATAFGCWFATFRKPLSLSLFAIATLGACLFIWEQFGSNWLGVLNSALSVLMLGFSMAAMLLGHWYLNQPKLSIQELTRISIILISIIAIRFVQISVCSYPLVSGLSELEFYRYLTGNPGVFVLMRWLWGGLAPLVLSYFIWGTVRIRSTQSATGILYVLVLFVLTGEILGQYLSIVHGIYL